ncbi:cytidine deaminase-like protein [Mytilinidion resinicola]|uniref:Cytidine deaminase-like protein n=1 Tax=Mytilinidion resinicola TaxID=574789 RepID=A0A6A6XYD4_9PEZI|nr:cytidine deaminase-like protein [Mytilinidion resinicola]KAF2801288.1 cytidine deaminase-like protein [Mytilinidion resinicola]
MTTSQIAQHGIFHGRVDAQKLGITPKQGRLVALRTRDELRAATELLDAYVVAVPAVFASAVLDVIRIAIPNIRDVNIQHLRRVVNFPFLPDHIQQTFAASAQTWPFPNDLDGAPQAGNSNPIETRYLLVSPASLIALPDLVASLVREPPFSIANIVPHVFTIPVPALAPTSAEEAQEWSEKYWSISYKNTNPYGPHPSLLERNQAGIEPYAGTWLALAEVAGGQTSSRGIGENVGCVIVQKERKEHRVIAVAGDARWRGTGDSKPCTEEPGNVMAHAVMRAIGMVARKRVRLEHSPDELTPDAAGYIACDVPLSPVEHSFFSVDNLPSTGYLCVDLDIYLTHEPCVMCSMAILHSRFRRCVFEHAVKATGGLTTSRESPSVENGLGYGISWRPAELNWKFLAWQWENE